MVTDKINFNGTDIVLLVILLIMNLSFSFVEGLSCRLDIDRYNHRNEICITGYETCASMYIIVSSLNLEICSGMGCVNDKGEVQTPITANTPGSGNGFVEGFLQWPIMVYGCNESTSIQGYSSVPCNSFDEGQLGCSSYNVIRVIEYNREWNQNANNQNTILILYVAPTLIVVAIIFCCCLGYWYRKESKKKSPANYEEWVSYLKLDGKIDAFKKEDEDKNTEGKSKIVTPFEETNEVINISSTDKAKESA